MGRPDTAASVNDRRAAVALAGLAGDRAAVRAALFDVEGAVRGALSALARLGEATTEDVGRAIGDGDPSVRRRACELAGSLPEGDFAALLSDPVPEVAEAAAFACAEQSIVSATPALAEIATTGADPLCRESAVAALGVLGDDRGLEALLQAMADVAAVRRRAVIALGAFESETVTAALEAALVDRDWQVRQAAEDVLGVSSPKDR